MTEVLIAFRRPPSLSASELREWVRDLRTEGGGALAVSEPEGASADELRLRVEIDDRAGKAAGEELADLMTDMRLLGLRPAVLSSVG